MTAVQLGVLADAIDGFYSTVGGAGIWASYVPQFVGIVAAHVLCRDDE
jgi:hypothetical protein